MRSKLRAGSASVLLLLVAGAAVASAGSSTASRSSGSDNRISVLRLVGRDVASAWLDLGVPGENSLGDQLHFTSDLIKLPPGGAGAASRQVGPPGRPPHVPHARKIGEDGGVCSIARIASDGATTYHCVATNSLPLGQITAQGLVTYAAGEDVRKEPYSFAITGGTGKYRTARGEITIKDVSAEEVRLTFRIIL